MKKDKFGLNFVAQSTKLVLTIVVFVGAGEKNSMAVPGRADTSAL